MMIFGLDRMIFLKWLTGNTSLKVYWDQIQGGTKSDFRLQLGNSLCTGVTVALENVV